MERRSSKDRCHNKKSPNYFQQIDKNSVVRGLHQDFMGFMNMGDLQISLQLAQSGQRLRGYLSRRWMGRTWDRSVDKVDPCTNRWMPSDDGRRKRIF